MKLGRRPGTFTTFIDSFAGETLLKVQSDEEGISLFSFHLYDSSGVLVLDSEGPRAFPNGTEVRSENQELLLLIPREPDASVQYRLYSRNGILMTCTDGARTQIFGGLRIEGNRPLPGRPANRPVT